jgi:hypothetical protein
MRRIRMPFYSWYNKKTEEKVDVMRSFSEYDVPPSKEKGECESEDGEWEKQIGNTFWSPGANWGPGKGNWAK